MYTNVNTHYQQISLCKTKNLRNIKILQLPKHTLHNF